MRLVPASAGSTPVWIQLLDRTNHGATGVTDAGAATTTTPPDDRGSRRDVGRSMGWFALAQVAVRLIGLVVVVVVARVFSTDDFGRYSVALALSAMLTMPVESGMGAYLVREGTQKPDRLGVLLGHALSLQAALGLAAVAAAAVVGSLLDYDRETLTTTMLMTVGAAVVVITRSQMSVLVSLKRARQFATFSSVQALVLAALTVLAAVLGWGPVGIGVATLITSVLSFPAAQIVLRRHWKLRITFQREGMRETFMGSFAYSASKLGNALLTYLDAVMVQALRGNAAAAQYGAAYRLYGALRMFPQIYADSISQPLAKLAKADRTAFGALYNRAASQLFIIGVPIAVGGFVLREPVMTAIFGERYTAAATAAGILLLTLLVTFPRTAIVVSALAIGLERQVALAYGMTIVFNVVANALLIPSYGPTGAALALAMSMPVFGGFLALSLSRAGIRMKVDARYLKAVVAGAAMSGAVLITGGLPLIVPIAVGAVVYVGALIALDTFDEADLDMLPGGRRLGWLVRTPRSTEAG